MPESKVTVPVSIAELGLHALQPGDIVVDIHKRARRPESVWSYTLVMYTEDHSILALSKGYRRSWQAIHGKGDQRVAGAPTRISPQRLLRMHRVGNLIDIPFRTEYPKEES
jgi:hypothetical protein